nr:MAG: hypothetical protein [Bacteriophage sp.]
MKKNKEMTPEEYCSIINDGLVEHVCNGGSLWGIEKATKEYIFELFEETVPYEEKKRLQDKAVIAINSKKNLPVGIRLVKCIWHNYK